MHKYRLHELEGALELYSSDPLIFRPIELYQITSDLRKVLERYNLYVVARRPRMSLDPAGLSITQNGCVVSGVIEAQVETRIIPMKFHMNLPAHLTAAKLIAPIYPFDYLCYFSVAGELIKMRLHDVMRFSSVPKSSLTDMHVEYVGQAFGDDGERDVVDRLIGNTGKVGHGSLQRVLAEVNASHPDQEVHLLLYSFEFHKKLTIAGGINGQPEPRHSFYAAPSRFEQFFESEIKRNVRIDLAEAALIRYFAPEHNDKYKKTFPAESHKILKRLVELDITGLCISLSTEENNIRTTSRKIKPSDAHFMAYPISTDQHRQTFFDIANLDTRCE
jgi:hypothetical protein